MSSVLFLLSLLVLPLVAAPAVAAPFSFQTMYVFGDSLSDTGNTYRLSGSQVPPPTRYSEGRFTDGPLWVEYLAEAANINLESAQSPTPGSVGTVPLAPGQSYSFAYGGAATGHENLIPAGFPVPGVLGQVDLYRRALDARGATADPTALHVVWAGANDYLFEISNSPRAPVENLQLAIEGLYELGARRFLIPNLPDLGNTPLGVQAGNPAKARLTARSHAHNVLLEKQLFRRLRSQYADIQLTALDMETLFARILDNPAAYGFSSGVASGPAAGCLFPPNDCSPVAGGERSFFWDELHPTSLAHRVIAQSAIDALTVGSTSRAHLLPAAAGGATAAGAAGTAATTAVPGPGAGGLFALGLICLAVGRCCRGGRRT